MTTQKDSNRSKRQAKSRADIENRVDELFAETDGASRFSERILRWYDKNRRELPWRRQHTAYAIWISEVMLQQTRVEAVIPYFESFLRAFPDVATLAAADEEEVLSRWSGLGYYSRARNLRKGAGVVTERFDGIFPRSYEEALTIPGIGRYTAAAILSIAYDLPHAVVDGNVARVLVRLHCLEPPEDRSQALLGRLADRFLDRSRPGDHNQAMMELGATLCTPRSPECGSCPVRSCCMARRTNRIDEFPKTAPRREAVDLDLLLLLLRDPEHRLLLERGRWPLLPHLWLPPILPEEETELPGSGGPARIPGIGLEVAMFEEAGTFRHSITHHRILFRVGTGRIDTVTDAGSTSGPVKGVQGIEHRFVSTDELQGVARSSVVEKALKVESVTRSRKKR